MMTPAVFGTAGVFVFGDIMDTTQTAVILTFLVFVASLVSVELALSAAIIEIALGLVAGNFLGIQSAPWMDFLAGFGGILLTFLAGIEVDVQLLRDKFKESLSIGIASFLVPYLSAIFFCHYLVDWTWKASLVAGCALSTTSLAVVYAVLVETGLNASQIGKIIMAATFITDMGTAIALSVSFAEWSFRTLIFFIVSALLIVIVPRFLPKVFNRYGSKVIEPEIKLLFFLLFGVMALASWGKSHAVLPVFILGLSLSTMFQSHRELQRKLRIVAFAMITPFFFIKGGMNVSLPELWSNIGLFLMLFFVKTMAKGIGVLPIARYYLKENAVYTTLLMSTGLTFGTISSVYGLQAGHINSSQFSVLVAVVIATAIIPTLIAQRWFKPVLSEEQKEEVMAVEEESL
jgi:Kef-type K+ transport system membrane component KefB